MRSTRLTQRSNQLQIRNAPIWSCSSSANKHSDLAKPNAEWNVGVPRKHSFLTKLAKMLWIRIVSSDCNTLAQLTFGQPVSLCIACHSVPSKALRSPFCFCLVKGMADGRTLLSVSISMTLRSLFQLEVVITKRFARSLLLNLKCAYSCTHVPCGPRLGSDYHHITRGCCSIHLKTVGLKWLVDTE